GNKIIAEQGMKQFYEIRNTIPEHSGIKESDTVLDIGCGDGLLGFGALLKIGKNGKVIFSDISESCVNACKEIYHSLENQNPADFFITPAQQLPFENESIDAIIFRSVLIYIDEKPACFKEFYRVLKPGGRISFFEPINIFTKRHQPKSSFYGHDISQ